MADQAAKFAGKQQAKLVVITLKSHDFPELNAEYAAFPKKLEQLGLATVSPTFQVGQSPGAPPDNGQRQARALGIWVLRCLGN